MQYLLNAKHIVFKDNSGQIKCSEIPFLLNIECISPNLIKLEKYQEIVTSISTILKKNKYDINNDIIVIHQHFYKLPGFIKMLNENIGFEISIISDLEFLIASQNLQTGNFSFIDISEFETNWYDFSIEGTKYWITSKKLIDNRKIKQAIASGLFSYNNISEINKILIEVSIDELVFYNFNDKNVHYLNDLGDVDFKNIFENISLVVNEHLSVVNSVNENTFIKSPLLAYLPIKHFIQKINKETYINEFDLINNCELNSTPEHILIENNIELQCYTIIEKIKLFDSFWMLSEIENISVSLSKTINNYKQTYRVDFSHLKTEFDKTLFKIENHALVKLNIKLEQDCYENIHLRIKTLDNEEFYQVIKD